MDDPQRDIFCAALQGYLASFAGTMDDPDPVRAVRYARRIVRESLNNDPKRACPDYTGPDEANETEDAPGG